ncbi:MAG TPA: hypothetical protein VMQ52_00960 [Candidatus Saccharimonadales bacterium]|jgi:hypothetical protein|nr:hypothetical protein [Candidatus Saccharimonadales bacterium]
MAKRKSLILSILGLVIIVVVVLVIVLVARHNNKTTNNNAPLTYAQTNVAIQQIETNWKNFFAYSTSLQGRENLLQNGSQFAQVIQGEFTALASQKSSASFNSINLTNNKTANVVYTINLNGQPVLNEQNGQALFINNSWKVSDSTLCGLISLSGSKPAVCKSY